MELLFSYGTLQEMSVQLATFGRLLRGERDLLKGYRRTTAVSNGREHGNVVPVEESGGGVEGTAFSVTPGELAAADAYEAADDYVRRNVTLASGRAAWVYVHSGDR
jgi:gamma-glutamylcyclotransferase (GGCT)/AIG2-like uncharacterized protein YtfP